MFHEQIKSNLECLLDALSDYPVYTGTGGPTTEKKFGKPDRNGKCENK